MLRTFLQLMLLFALLFAACKKSDTPAPNPTPPVDSGDTVTVVNPQVDPALAATIGFFMDDWQPINFTKPSSFTLFTPPSSATATVVVDRSTVITKIPQTFASNNANSWMSQLVTEIPLMDYLTKLHPHIIRFPGGSISDIYFWNAAVNAPPADAPAQLVKADGSVAAAGYWFGNNTASWTCSLDNYYNMLQQTNNKGMITVNYGYARYGTGSNPVAAAAHLAADWVRYDKGKTKYWEVGNENFGDWEGGYRINTANNKDGQPEYLTGQLYGQHFKIFVDSMRKAAREIGSTIYIGAVMVEATAESWWTSTAKTWNAGAINTIGNTADFYIVHNYYTPFQTNSNADAIIASAESVTQTMMDYVKQSVTNAGVTQKPVILGEFNINAVGSKQQVSNVNGLHSLMVLGEALKNKYGLTARWDLANGWVNGDDHGMFNVGDEPGNMPKWNPRPSYYYYYFFKKMLGDRLVNSTSNVSSLVSYASSFTSGEMGVTLVNKSNTTVVAEIKFQNFKRGTNFYWYSLQGGSDNGEFSGQVGVNGISSTYTTGGPLLTYQSIYPYAAPTSGGIKLMVPARGAVFVVVDKK